MISATRNQTSRPLHHPFALRSAWVYQTKDRHVYTTSTLR